MEHHQIADHADEKICRRARKERRGKCESARDVYGGEDIEHRPAEQKIEIPRQPFRDKQGIAAQRITVVGVDRRLGVRITVGRHAEDHADHTGGEDKEHAERFHLCLRPFRDRFCIGELRIVIVRSCFKLCGAQ